MNRDHVILVNQFDEQIGTMEKIKAHQEGRLHRAFSIFIFNDEGKLLLQQRAGNKYHGAALWTNTCCSHPQENEDIFASAEERLLFEMGIKCRLIKAFSFIYKSTVENGLIEHELDHVFIGIYNNDPFPNPNEVSQFRWADKASIRKELSLNPELFTVWFKEIWERVVDHHFKSL